MDAGEERNERRGGWKMKEGRGGIKEREGRTRWKRQSQGGEKTRSDVKDNKEGQEEK